MIAGADGTVSAHHHHHRSLGHRSATAPATRPIPFQGPPPAHYGDSKCPCIGWDNIAGDTLLELQDDDGKKVDVMYPADLGARCEKWDDERHTLCKSDSKKPWCKQSWCYVDPCKCDIDVLPQMTLYQPETTFRNLPLFYSYATCGGEDMFTKKHPPLGSHKCRCVGFAGVAGTTEVSFKSGQVTEYPADLGSTCSAWDADTHPDCKGENPPSWCKAQWCYIDPCECDLPGGLVPKISAYMPHATLTGKNLYYSYETCGSPDTWTAENHPEACVNQETEEECDENARCAWIEGRCLGRELAHHPLCKDARKELGEKLAVAEALAEAERAGVDGQRPSQMVTMLVALFSVAACGFASIA